MFDKDRRITLSSFLSDCAEITPPKNRIFDSRILHLRKETKMVNYYSTDNPVNFYQIYNDQLNHVTDFTPAIEEMVYHDKPVAFRFEFYFKDKTVGLLDFDNLIHFIAGLLNHALHIDKNWLIASTDIVDHCLDKSNPRAKTPYLEILFQIPGFYTTVGKLEAAKQNVIETILKTQHENWNHHLPVVLLNSINNMIRIPGDYWLMYGGSRVKSKLVYRYCLNNPSLKHKTAKKVLIQKLLDMDFKHHMYLNTSKSLFIRRRLSEIQAIEDSQERALVTESNLKQTLALLLSSYNLIHNLVERRSSFTITDDSIEEEYFDEEKIIFLKLLHGIKKERYNNKPSWLSIGRALVSLVDNSKFEFKSAIEQLEINPGLNKWIQLTTTYSKKFTADDCRDHFVEFYALRGKITHKTLAYYCRLDNLVYYKKWHQDWVDAAFTDYEENDSGDTGLAQIIFRYYWLDFININARRDGYYYFVGSCWKKSENASDLILKIKGDFKKYLLSKSDDYREKIRSSSGSKSRSRFARAQYSAPIENVFGILKAINDGAGQKKILNQLDIDFYDEDFGRLLNSNPSIIPLKNLVIEIVDDACIMRPGKPEDFVDTCINFTLTDFYFVDKKYKRYYTKAKEKCQEEYNKLLERLDSAVSWDKIKNDLYNWIISLGRIDVNMGYLIDWLTKAYTDRDQFLFALLFDTSILKRDCTDKKAVFMMGPRGSSKSTIKHLFEATLGDFVTTVKSQFLTTQSRDADGADSQIMNALESAVTFIDEVNNPMYKERFKKITGGDKVLGRRQYEVGGKAKNPYFKVIIICNRPPRFYSPDKAVIDRVLILPHDSVFLKKGYPKDPVEQRKRKVYPAENNFGRKVAKMANPFLWLLVKLWPFYCRYNLPDSEKIEKATSDYWKRTDNYSMFVDENMEQVFDITGDGRKTVDLESYVKVSDVSAKFTEWFKGVFAGQRPPDRDQIEYNISDRINQQSKGGRWFGYRLADDED